MKWQMLGLALLAAAWPVMNSIEYGIVSGAKWEVLMFALVFAALGCVLKGRCKE